ncbi:MAG: threonylcarbamoyl-AMP synthase [Sterolibacterium sp.]|jgi:tRNA threonylcarbamoyl adenosine modification protein (Sua5/YciO/YrdC/YwlC family)|nr:threonylcarbamoyl-AMP synthase [Sterolibacterium sp.]MBP9798588.1 threonylcarbamoyl-AMP synthase [Sterolibacterium sp.]
MAQLFYIHPDEPQPRLIRHAVEIIREGGLVALPTDSAYALVGHLGDAALLERIRRIRGVDEKHLFTLMCRDLSQIATYARVDNSTYRLLKATTPGSYTFILEGSRELPKRILHPRRKTVGLRIPDHVLVQRLLQELDEPLLTSTLILPEEMSVEAGSGEGLTDSHDIRERLGTRLDLVIDGGPCPGQPTTVIDLAGGYPQLIRAGRGSLEPFDFSA